MSETGAHTVGRATCRRRWALPLGLALLLPAAPVPAGAAGEAEIPFELPAGAAEVVLEVEVFGGGTARTSTTTWLGDGRVEYRLEGPRGEAIEEHATRVEVGELTDLVGRLIGGGLLSYDAHDVRTRMEQRHRIPSINDGASYRVRLVVFAADDGGELRRIEKEIRAEAPLTLARAYPDIPELQALADLGAERLALLLEMRRKASAEDRR